MKKVIENIGKKVLDFIYDFENNDFELEGGCYEPENGICEGSGVTISGHITIGGHDVTVSVWTKSKTVEVLFEDDEYYNIEEAVNGYVAGEIDYDMVLAGAEEASREFYMDEFQRNGFAGEADYNRYRYSA